MAATPAATIPVVSTDSPKPQRIVPFRNATQERTEIMVSDAGTISAVQQSLERPIEGTGYLYGIVLDFIVTTAANAAVVAYQEDGPWAALAQITLRDTGAEAINLSGYELFLANLAHAQYANRFWDQSSLFSATTGNGATGGSFGFLLRVPAGINRRTLIGVLGNQDRSVKYSLRTDIGTTTQIYSTPPTTPGTFALTRIYENYSVPGPIGPGGQQAIVPETYGTLSFVTSTRSETPPAGGSTVNHYIRRTGNTVRYYMLVFRLNGSRANAETNAASRIQMKIGDTDLFNETYRYRRAIMFERYGYDFPNGVLLYETLHDFSPRAGSEMGDDWWNTQAVANGQFLITYPAGFGSTNNTLQIVTNDLALAGMPLAA